MIFHGNGIDSIYRHGGTRDRFRRVRGLAGRRPGARAPREVGQTVAQDKLFDTPGNIWASRNWPCPKTPRTATDECRSHYVGEDRVLLRPRASRPTFSLSITVRGRVACRSGQAVGRLIPSHAQPNAGNGCHEQNHGVTPMMGGIRKPASVPPVQAEAPNVHEAANANRPKAAGKNKKSLGSVGEKIRSVPAAGLKITKRPG
jgi:hypothetical protein